MNIHMARKRNSPVTIYERVTADLPINSMVAPAIVDDPLERGAKLRVARSVRDDPLAGMHARGQIDDAMLAAGRLWQRHYENCQLGTVRAIDPAKEAVDGGRIAEPLGDKQIKAFTAINTADRHLGKEGCALIRDILGSRMTIMDAARSRGATSDLEVKYIGRRFRECLESLARLWGFASGASNRG